MRLCAPHLLLSVLSWGLGRWHGCKVVAVTQIFGLPTGKLCACVMPVLSVVWHNGEAVWCHCKWCLELTLLGMGKVLCWHVWITLVICATCQIHGAFFFFFPILKLRWWGNSCFILKLMCFWAKACFGWMLPLERVLKAEERVQRVSRRKWAKGWNGLDVIFHLFLVFLSSREGFMLLLCKRRRQAGGKGKDHA